MLKLDSRDLHFFLVWKLGDLQKNQRQLVKDGKRLHELLYPNTLRDDLPKKGVCVIFEEIIFPFAPPAAV